MEQSYKNKKTAMVVKIAAMAGASRQKCRSKYVKRKKVKN